MKYMIVIATTCCSLLLKLSVAQTAAADNKISKAITFRPIPKGPEVMGVFEGRPPCNEVAKQLKLPTPADCEKIKWDLILYQYPVTFQPATYVLTLIGGGDVIKQADGNSYQQKVLTGKWTISKGIQSNPAAEVIGLALDTGGYMYLLKGDDNVLFVLDEKKGFRVGNEDFSYTLNRVELVPGKK